MALSVTHLFRRPGVIEPAELTVVLQCRVGAGQKRPLDGELIRERIVPLRNRERLAEEAAGEDGGNRSGIIRDRAFRIDRGGQTPVGPQKLRMRPVGVNVDEIKVVPQQSGGNVVDVVEICLLYTSDAADE